MVRIDVPHREVTIKLVYYGPALSGKTTNLQALHRHLGARAGSDLVTLDTENDRTLFFDLLPIHFQASSGTKINLKLFTVPGQVFHRATRKIVLQGVDGVAFVADSRVSETRNNNESWLDLKSNLKENGLSMSKVARVVQFNKRDLPLVRTDEEIATIAERGNEPVVSATATEGVGVVETFLALCQATWRSLQRRYEIEQKTAISGRTFMEAIAETVRTPYVPEVMDP